MSTTYHAPNKKCKERLLLVKKTAYWKIKPTEVAAVGATML
jgi:hypothetical protein